MFFAWGSGTKSVEAVADFGVHKCPICKDSQPFKVTLNYGYAHLWYLFRWVTSRKYFAICKRCGNGHAIEPRQITGKAAGNPISFMDRRGWLVGLALIAGLIGLAAFAIQESDKKLAALSASPRAGDIYMADLSKIAKAFQDHPSYGLMRLTGVAGDDLTFQIAQSAYNKSKGARHDLTDKVYAKPGYFSNETTVLKLGDLKQLVERKVIESINREGE
jgi:hypothetical protein